MIAAPKFSQLASLTKSARRFAAALQPPALQSIRLSTMNKKTAGDKDLLAIADTGQWPGLADEVLAILRCLARQNRLRQRSDGLECPGCGKQYPALNGVVRFVDAQNY